MGGALQLFERPEGGERAVLVGVGIGHPVDPNDIAEFAALAASGMTNKQIAGELDTCERTVKAHRAHVMEKMQLASVAELVHAADQLMVGGIAALPR